MHGSERKWIEIIGAARATCSAPSVTGTRGQCAITVHPAQVVAGISYGGISSDSEALGANHLGSQAVGTSPAYDKPYSIRSLKYGTDDGI